MKAPPLQQFYDLADVSEGGVEVAVRAEATQREALARWAGVEKVESFGALVDLRKSGPRRFSYAARLTADVVQTCVVTLEPLSVRLERDIARTLELARGRSRPGQDDPPVWTPDDDDEEPEKIETSRYDLAGPLLEEFVLAIDPYPRAPGVAFELPVPEDNPRDSPFAVLKALKKRN
jgi:uncharacterized metal-binding protein YceD (DUF177 family)